MCRKLTDTQLIRREEDKGRENVKKGALNGMRLRSKNQKCQLFCLWIYLVPAIAAVIIVSQYKTGIYSIKLNYASLMSTLL